MPKRLSARDRLAQHMDDRRADLDLRWADVAELAEMTTETLRQARFGDGEIRPLTRRRIERALQWQQGSVTAILNGGDPTPAAPAVVDVPSEDSDLRHVAAIVEMLSEDEAKRVAQMLQRVPCAVSSDGVDTVILINQNHLGGDTSPLRDHLNRALRKLGDGGPPPIPAMR